MKTDWSKWSLTSDSTAISSDRYAPTTGTAISIINDDICDAITCAVERKMDMEEKKARGVSFDKLEKTLRKMGIFLTEVRRDSYNDYAEITCRVNPIDWYISLDEKNTNKWRHVNATRKYDRPHPKRVIFSGPATTILWKDGTKTTVKCSDEDVWEDEVGIAMCYLKKLLGNKGNYNNIFREAMKVAAVQEPKDTIASSIDSSDIGMTSISANAMRKDINRINKCINDAANALIKATTEDIVEKLGGETK